MSIRLMTMVFDRYPGGGSELLLALAMADHARDDGTRIWPSLDELARKTRQSRRTVQRQIAKMVTSGWLEQVRAATGRPGATNEYRVSAAWVAGAELPETGVNLSSVEEADGFQTGDRLTPVDDAEDIHTDDKLAPVEARERGVTGDARGDMGDARGDTAMTPESSEPSRTITPLPPDGGAAGFDAIFETYPNHANRAKAERRWRRLMPDAALQRTMRAAIEAQRLSRKWTKDGGGFVPEFATWLRNQGWRDGSTATVAWDAKRSSIEAKAAELGMRPWDESDLSIGRETFAVYTERVRRRVEEAQEEAACASS